MITSLSAWLGDGQAMPLMIRQRSQTSPTRYSESAGCEALSGFGSVWGDGFRYRSKGSHHVDLGL